MSVSFVSPRRKLNMFVLLLSNFLLTLEFNRKYYYDIINKINSEFSRERSEIRFPIFGSSLFAEWVSVSLNIVDT